MKNKISLFLLAVILIFGFSVRLYRIDYPLADWHSWRQSDTAAVTKILIKDHFNVLVPRYFDISNVQTGYFNPMGYRFVEFPIFNLLHAAGYLAFPQYGFEVWGRLISIFASLITTACLYFIAKKLKGDLAGLATASFYAFMPYNIFFTRVILPDPLSTMFGVLAVLLYYQYTEDEKLKFLYLSGISLSLGLLVKPHAIFFAIPMAYLGVSKFGIKKLLQNVHNYIVLDIILVPTLLWRAWMGRKAYMIGIAHITWAYNGDGIRFRPAFWRWLFGERIGNLMLGFWGLIPFGFGVLAKKKNSLPVFFLLGAFAYMSVFATANVRHDYYQIFVVPSICLCLGIGASEMLLNWQISKLKSVPLLLLSVSLMLGLGWYAIRGDYNVNDPNMVAAGQRADQILPRDARVIAPYNGNSVFLYQINRFGWPVVTRDISDMIRLGANYYVSTTLGDTDTVNFEKKFETVEKTDQYIILNLNKPIKQ